MRCAMAFLLTLGVWACAPASPPTRTADQPVVYDVPAARGTMHLTRDDGVVSGRLEAAPERVWSYLPAVYVELGIEAEDLTLFDPVARRIGIHDYRTRRLGGQRLSRLLDCGPSMGTPKADNGQARVDLETWLEPEEGGTRVRVRFEGRVRDTGTSSGVVSCPSKGEIERDLTARLSRLVSGG
jgi:hypothetical protein